MTYQIVHTPTQTLTHTEEAFLARIEAGFFTVTGVTETLPPNLRRPMLCNQPKLEGFVGPCYGGPDCIRYESAEAYRFFSA